MDAQSLINMLDGIGFILAGFVMWGMLKRIEVLEKNIVCSVENCVSPLCIVICISLILSTRS